MAESGGVTVGGGVDHAEHTSTHLFATPGTWRILDAVIAATMLALGISLALSTRQSLG
jgi:arginine exporter protein ArgO